MILPGLVEALVQSQDTDWSHVAWNAGLLTSRDYAVRCLELLMVDVAGAEHVIRCRGYGGDTDHVRSKKLRGE